MKTLSTLQAGRWSITFALLTAMAGILLSLFAHSKIAQVEAAAARQTAVALRQHTEQELKLFVDVLESVRALHALSGAIDQEAMDEFIEKGLIHQHEVLGAFGLIQQVGSDMRSEIENRPKPAPGAYDIIQRGAGNSWIYAANRLVYYPLTWQSRPNALNIPVGFDFGSEQEVRTVIEHIAHTRQTELVPKPLYTPSNPQPPSYWVLAPVLTRGSPRFIIGFAIAILHPQTILDKVTALSVHSPQLSLIPSAAPLKESTRFTDKAWIIRQPLTAVGTKWIFECSLPVDTAESRSTAALAFGLVVTALMTALILILASRTRRIEAEVQIRTEELRDAYQQLEQSIQERAQMEEEMNELSARERRRIGRDLHDSLGQKLTGAVFLSRSLMNWFEKHKANNTAHRGDLPDTQHPTPDTQSIHAATLNETLKDAVSQVRNMARGLASITLNEESLEESIEQLADEMGALYNIPCDVSHNGKLPDLARKTKEQLYFIVREAVNNAAKHAKPKHITISIESDDSSWALRIEDNGGGLPKNKTNHEGLGLRIMRHRAIRIGAEFSIISNPGKGTVIEVKSGQQPSPQKT